MKSITDMTAEEFLNHLEQKTPTLEAILKEVARENGAAEVILFDGSVEKL